MSVRRRLSIGSAAWLALLALAPGALADEQVQAQPTDRFAGDVTMDQGEALTFMNADIDTHNVTSSDVGPDGKPLFASQDATTGQTTAVVGAQYLTTGTYRFMCTIHPFMTATLTVTSAGTPQPRPGSGTGGGGTGGGGAPAVDTTAPTVKVGLAGAKLSAVRKTRRLPLKVTVSEAAAVKLTAVFGKTTIASGKTTIAAAGSKTVKLGLTNAGRKALRGRRSAKLVLRAAANDASGNRGQASATVKLRG